MKNTIGTVLRIILIALGLVGFWVVCIGMAYYAICLVFDIYIFDILFGVFVLVRAFYPKNVFR